MAVYQVVGIRVRRKLNSARISVCDPGFERMIGLIALELIRALNNACSAAT